MNSLLPNQQRAANVLLIFWLMSGVAAISFTSNFMEYNLLSKGVPDEAAANSNDIRQGVVGLLQITTSILSIIFFILWIRRAYANLHRIFVPGLSFSEGWAAGSWFVPILNLIRPFQIMKEVWIKTQLHVPERQEIREASLVGWWWALYLTSQFSNRLAYRVSSQAEDLDSLLTASTVNMIADLIEIPALLTAIALVKTVSKFESELFSSKYEMDITDHLVPN